MFKQKKIVPVVDERPESYSFCQAGKTAMSDMGRKPTCAPKSDVRFTPESGRVRRN